VFKARSLLVFLVPLIIYLLLPTRNFYWDGVAFAIDIEKAAREGYPLYHPNHLIYMTFGLWLCKALRAVGWSGRALFLLQAANSVLAAASVLLVYRILRGEKLSQHASAALAALFAFSATWWKFSTDAGAYVPSVFFVLAAYWLLQVSNGAKPLAVACVHTVGMLFHQLAALFFPVALVSFRTRARAIQYAVAALSLTVGAYWYAYNASAKQSFLSWLTAHSPDTSFSFRPLHNTAMTLQSNLRLFFGGKLRLFHWDPITIGGLVLLIAVLGLLVVQVKHVYGALRASEKKLHPLLVWISCYLIFLFFWLPQNTFYRLFYLPALILLLGVLISGRETPSVHRAVWLAAAALFLWNLTFFIYPHSRPQNNPPLRFAMEQRAKWPAGTGIVFHNFHPDLWTISYFTPQASWISLPRPDISLLESYRSQIRGELWLEATAYDLIAATPEGRQWLARELGDPNPTAGFRFYRLRRLTL
jgi:hypothetical protein